MAHTHGPWTSEPQERSTRVRATGGTPICEIWWSGDDSDANARLIAAAPDMLEALKAIQEWLLFSMPVDNREETWAEPFVKANDLTVAAIAKAEGP